MTDQNRVVDAAPSPHERADGPVIAPGGGAQDNCPKWQQPYRTLAVLAVSLWLAVVPVLSLLGQRRLAVIWLGVEVAALAVIRIQRPDGTWIGARGRAFDVIFGAALAVGLFFLSYYANLPRVR